MPSRTFETPGNPAYVGLPGSSTLFCEAATPKETAGAENVLSGYIGQCRGSCPALCGQPPDGLTISGAAIEIGIPVRVSPRPSPQIHEVKPSGGIVVRGVGSG